METHAPATHQGIKEEDLWKSSLLQVQATLPKPLVRETTGGTLVAVEGDSLVTQTLMMRVMTMATEEVATDQGETQETPRIIEEMRIWKKQEF